MAEAQEQRKPESRTADPPNPSVLGGGRGGGGRMQRGMPVAKAKDMRGTVKRLWGYFGDERKQLVALSALVLTSTAIGLVVPYLIGQAIDTIENLSGSSNVSLLRIIVIGLVAAYLLDWVIHFGQAWFMAGVSQRIVRKLRNTLFIKLQKLPISFFDKHTHGEIMSRLSNDIESVSNTVAHSTTQLMSSALMITGSFIMMVLLSPYLTLASMVTVPLVYLVAKVITKRTRALFKQQQKMLGELNGHIEEMISGISVVKAFNHEETVVLQFDAINHSLYEVGVKAQIWSGFIMPLMNVINNIGFTAVAAVGGMLAVQELITIGVIAAFLSYSRQFVRPLNEIASVFNTLQSALAGAERVFEVLDEEEETSDTEDTRVLANPAGHIRFEQVSFGYVPNVNVFHNISFEVDPGSSIALVGPTGAGKTTLINLLTRFYEVDSGRILIDGHDIRSYSRNSLRQCFGIVLQDTYLFSGTIRENIQYGKLDACFEDILQAAKLANAHGFIQRLPNGYDTHLSESGTNLSQGQQQLLAIARAVLANPAILILDEATSNVDTRTELQIQEAMLELMQGRTTFIIAHRLSTIRDADRIMVVDKGEIVEWGNHDSLMEQAGVYHDLYFSQFRNIS